MPSLGTAAVNFRLLKQNICGMSVVPADYDQLRRYNLAEISDVNEEHVESTHTKATHPSENGTGEDAADKVDQQAPPVPSSVGDTNQQA